MADGSLSQEEIDALLGGGTLPGLGGGLEAEPTPTQAPSQPEGDGGLEIAGPSSDAIAAALGTGFTPPPPKQPLPKAPVPGLMGTSSSNLNLLMDVTLSLTVELGRTNMLIKDVLQLSEGAVVELDKASGEDLDLLANGKFIGKGKLIAIDDYYGVLVTHIVDPMERLTMMV